MQEALKNPHYKKIWEQVILNRHPEAKSLEEALNMEATKDECYILEFENSNPLMHAVLEEKRSDYPFYTKFQILGRPITLEDILSLLSNLEINEKIRIRDIDITFKNTYLLPEKRLLDNDCVSINIAKHLESEDEDDDDEELIHFYFELTKPLHEQSLETWESISKLID